MQLRTGQPVDPTGPPFIAEMGVSDSGRRTQLGGVWPAPNATYEFQNAAGWDVDGFYFRTGGDAALDPVVFTFEGSEACDGVWTTIAASR
eukprot:3351306-Rhodomonas_salina.1